jgi:hypothetical protein
MAITSNDFSTKIANYKYFVVDILTNSILAEVPFADVSFERALKGAGAFSGKIAIVPDTKDLDLYESTMPGKTALYVTRNGICVWGGIIWSREYSITSRSLSVNASEFTSYLFHRVIWKTYNYNLSANLYKLTQGGKVKVELLTRKILFPATDTAGNRTSVILNFAEYGFVKYNGTYKIVSEAGYEPTVDYFYVEIPALPPRPDSYYSRVEVTSRVDTYQYVKELITEVLSDFVDVDFSNEAINPGVREAFNVTYKTVLNNVATIVTNTSHNLIAGQRVDIKNVDANLDGVRTVKEVLSDTSFTFDVVTANIATNTPTVSTTYPLKYREVTTVARRSVKNVKASSNIVTVTTAVPHLLKVTDNLIMQIEKKHKRFNNNGAAVSVTAVPSATTFTYNLTTDNTPTAGINVKDSYCKYSVDVKALRLTMYPGYTHDFDTDSEIYVDGVDLDAWETPMYDGYHTVTEVAGDDTWFQFEPKYAMTKEPGSVIDISRRKYKKSSNLVSITTTTAHGLFKGDTVSIDTKASGTDVAFDGTVEIKNIPGADNTFTYRPIKTVSKDVKDQASTGTVTRTKAIIGSIDRTPSTISKIQRVASTATITTAAAHNFIEGDYVLVACNVTSFNNSNVPVQVSDVPSTTTFSYSSAGSPVAADTAATGIASAVFTGFGKARYPSTAAASGTTRTITCSNHGLSTDDWVSIYIAGKDSIYNNGGAPVKITKIDANSFSYTVAGSATDTSSGLDAYSIITSAAYVTKTPVVYARSYGEFPDNADLGGLEFGTTTYSQKAFINATITGSDLQNVGEHLDKYSNTPEGFEYRIDCSVQTVDGVQSFKRTFVIVPRKPEVLTDYLTAYPLAPGEYAPPSAFGADKLTFEYPGNVADVTLSENAENAITRMFIVGDGGGAGEGEASAHYSGSALTDLLSNGWPILDGGEKQSWPQYGYNQINRDKWDNYDAELDFKKTADRYLNESKPPMGEYSIKINGSLDPVVGTYNPGDWCQLVINDDFISERLQSYLEPRSTAIVRKIESINVSVPNSPAFPEDITLNLIPEWEVDVRG